MTNRDNILPPKFQDNPEAIIRAANAARRRAARRRAAATASRAALRDRIQIGRQLNRLSALPPLPNSLSRTDPTPLFFTPPEPPATAMADSKNPALGASNAETQETKSPYNQFRTGGGPNVNTQDVDLMCLIMEAQHCSIVQAQQDRAAAAERMERMEAASAVRISRLEEAMLLLSVRTEETHCTASPTRKSTVPPGRVDLQKFCTADGPAYVGPFHAIKPFLKWILEVQIFFASKGVTNNTNKIRIVGSLLREINALTFYSNSVKEFVTLSWAEFKGQLFDFALPPLWRTKICHQIHKLAMGETKTFLAYSTRACTLQSMINFDGPLFAGFTLAEFLFAGLLMELQALVNNFQLLEVQPFVYSGFKARVQQFHDGLPKRTSG
ncbi:hypothetical protein PCANC_06300 [Puccinia coronata f. sp. avenae]|uniref:Retrotransposon gag domain-containing protein n=1 Tax=Puccinia coronata f. sp. avenae TaxID=200324 RepID=A0A2N5VRR0_9BASI|nr:hypothetical protein PCANC_06300 [Puccinia coronata f. sp. avenae]